MFVNYLPKCFIIRIICFIFAPESKQVAQRGTEIAVRRLDVFSHKAHTALCKGSGLQIYKFYCLVVRKQANI